MTDPELQQNAEPTEEPSATEADTAPTAVDAIESAEADPLTAAFAERDECRDKLLRAHAELDNFRKRVQREREEERRYAIGSLAGDLLPVLDNLQRAVAAAEKGGTVDDLRQGVEMVLGQALETLAKHHVTPIAAAGEPFDPNHHEALTQVPSPDHPPLTILEEVEAGYKIHDRVLRPSKVIVSSAPPESRAGNAESE